MFRMFGVESEASLAFGDWLLLLGVFIALVALAWVCL
jgi:hypothetical protein